MKVQQNQRIFASSFTADLCITWQTICSSSPCEWDIFSQQNASLLQKNATHDTSSFRNCHHPTKTFTLGHWKAEQNGPLWNFTCQYTPCWHFTLWGPLRNGLYVCTRVRVNCSCKLSTVMLVLSRWLVATVVGGHLKKPDLSAATSCWQLHCQVVRPPSQVLGGLLDNNCLALALHVHKSVPTTYSVFMLPIRQVWD